VTSGPRSTGVMARDGGVTPTPDSCGTSSSRGHRSPGDDVEEVPVVRLIEARRPRPHDVSPAPTGDTLTDPDDIRPGQVLRVPLLA
jgi:hypothetical protein